MAGHSKWANIKHRKGAQDAKRGKLFTKLAKDIAIAAREGGGDTDTNIRLRLAIEKGRAANMPKDNIERAIKRGTGEDKDGVAFDEISYEGYANHGIAVIVECVTDNKRRSVSDVRAVFNKYGGNMGENGSVSWQFERKSYFTILTGDLDEEAAFELALEVGAEDVVWDAEVIEITGPISAYGEIASGLADAGHDPDDAMLRMEPKNMMALDPAQAMQVLNTIEKLEELDDVQNVYHNLELTDAVIAALEAA